MKRQSPTNSSGSDDCRHGGRSGQSRQGFRGGRLTKLAGMVASFAPAAAGSAKAVLLSTASLVGVLAGAFLGLTANEARATCTQSPPGTWTCTGAANARVSITRSGGVNINLAQDFTMSAASQEGFLISKLGAGDVSLTQSANGGAIWSPITGISAFVVAGSASTSISVSGTVTGVSSYGAIVTNVGTHGNQVSIVGAGFSGGKSGIFVGIARGPVSISASGTVTGASDHGIYARTRTSSAGALTVTAATVTGGKTGIRAVASGTGAVSIKAGGAVTGTAVAGVKVNSYASASDIMIDVVAVTGNAGIDARHGGSGKLDIKATGSVSGTGAEGIFGLVSNSSGGALTITAAAVAGSSYGIRALSSGTGDLSISASGSVSGTGTSGRGIDAQFLNSSGDSLTITAAAVAGSSYGIRALSSGTGSVSISASGAVTGGTGASNAAIKTDVSSGRNVTISLKSGASVGTTTGTPNAIIDTAGNAAVTVNTGASIIGKVNLGAGNDTLAFAGGTFSNVTEIKGGAGNDSLTFSGGASGAMSGVAEWETVSIQSGSTVSFGTGTHTLGAGTLTVSSGGTLNVGDDSDTGDKLTVSGNFAGGGTVTLDANFSSTNSGADSLTISGNVTGTTTVDPSRIGTGDLTNANSVARIDGVILVAGTVIAGAFELGTITGIGQNSAFNYELEFDTTNKRFDLVRTYTNVCAETGNSGAFTCSGAVTIAGPQSLSSSGATALSVTLNSETPVDTAGTAFTLTQTGGTGGITFTQSGSGERIKGAQSGIVASNSGGGAISINVNGPVTGTGSDGIFVDHDGTDATSVSVSGSVRGGSGAGNAAIRTDVSSGSAVTISLNSGASVGAAGRNAIVDTAGNAAVTVNTGAAIAGKVNLGAGNDTLAFAGGTFSGVTEMDGGAGTDTLTFNNVSGSVSGTVTNWERINIESGATIRFGALAVGDDSDTDDELTVAGNFAGGGTVTLNANFLPDEGASDKLVITGNVTGATSLVFTQLAGNLSSDQTDTDRPQKINDVVTVQGNVEEGAFTMSVIEFGSVAYRLEFDGSRKAFDLSRFFLNKCEAASGGSGAFTCSGANRIGATQSLSASGTTALSVTLNSETPVSAAGTAFTLTQTGGTGGISFTQSATGSAVTAATDGIVASNEGGGAISIAVNGSLTASGGDAIRAINDSSGAGIAITAAAVSGSESGIKAVESGSGAVSVRAMGSVTAGEHGISVRRVGAGRVDIVVSSAVTGGSGAAHAAIETDAPGGSAVRIALNSGASALGAGDSHAIRGGAGDSEVTVAAGAAIAGKVSLGSGTDTLAFAGGSFDAVTRMDGGDGSGDTLRFSGGSGSLHGDIAGSSGEGLKGWESVVIQSGATLRGAVKLADDSGNLTFDGAAIGGVTALDGGGGSANTLSFNSVSGVLATSAMTGWEDVVVGAGSQVRLTGSRLPRTASARLSVTGTLAFGTTTAATDTFTVQGDFAGGGAVAIDANFSAPENGDPTADRLVIEGSATGTTAIAINDLTPADGTIPGGDIEVVTVSGAAAASAFTLAGTVAHGAYVYGIAHVPDDTGDGAKFVLRPGSGNSDAGAVLRLAPAAIAAGFARSATLAARNAARMPGAAGSGIGAPATLTERLEKLLGQDEAEMGADGGAARSLWARFHSDSQSSDAADGFGESEIDSAGILIGADLLSGEAAGGTWIAGLTAQYGSVSAEAKGAGGTGRQEATGYGLGAAATWFGTDGFYADAAAQFGSFEADYSADSAGVIKNGVGGGASSAALEVGKRFAASDAMTLVPRGRLGWSSVSSDKFTSQDGVEIDLGTSSVMEASVGVAAEFGLSKGAVRVSGTLSRRLGDPDGVAVGGQTVAQAGPDGWMELGFGGTFDMDADSVVFLDGAYRAGGDSTGLSLSGGLKFNW